MQVSDTRLADQQKLNAYGAELQETGRNILMAVSQLMRRGAPRGTDERRRPDAEKKGDPGPPHYETQPQAEIRHKLERLAPGGVRKAIGRGKRHAPGHRRPAQARRELGHERNSQPSRGSAPDMMTLRI
jgi:hypothetical protein